MAKNIVHGVFWSRFLLVVAAVFLNIPTFTGFPVWYLLRSPRHTLALLLVIVGSLFAALGIREFAGILFDREDKPNPVRHGVCIAKLDSAGR